jgi:hypothetical protein
MRWSELPPDRRDVELAKAGTTAEYLVKDLWDVPDPELQEILVRLPSEEAQQRFALEYFGDEKHPQPENRREWADAWFDGEPAFVYRTPDFGRLPRLEDDEPTPAAEKEPASVTRGHKSRGTLVRSDLAEAGLRLHVTEGLGRRTLPGRVPGLTEWEAAQVIWWHDKVGRPAGLWFDNDRLRWGPAITPVFADEQVVDEVVGVGEASSTTPRWLRLPSR